MADNPRFETRAIHIGQGADEATGATIVPIYQTATFTQDAIGTNRGTNTRAAETPRAMPLRPLWHRWKAAASASRTPPGWRRSTV